MAAAESASYYNGPLQLIRIDESGKCHVQDEAVSILSQIKGRLAVVAIAGLYRTGKSFLLNRLLGLQDGFEIGPSVNPCTKGLWMWGQPVQLAADYHCILIDTEGLGSTQRTASCDMQILSLSILLSSYFVYNSMGAIDEQAIDDLHLVLHLAKNIHVKSKKGQDVEKNSDLSQYFPMFLWVLRDFHLRLIDEKGSQITEKEYLENALRPLSGQPDKNKLRDVIRELFRDRDCCTIVRPVADEADLRNIQKLPYESLRPQFRTQVEAFVKRAYMNLKPKKIDGTTVDGGMFVNLASEYCKAINASAVPTIQSAWTSVVQHQLRICLKDAVQVYRSQMNDKAMQHLPMMTEQLHDIHKAAKTEAKKLFLAPKFDGNDPKFREYCAELSNRTKQLYEHVKQENVNTSQRQCERLAKELYSRQIENKLNVKGTYKAFDQLMADWDHVRKTYLGKAAGPAQIEVLSGYLFERMVESLQRTWDDLKAASEEKHSSLQQRVAEAEARSGQVRDSMDNQRSRQHESLEVAKKQWLAERIDLERQLEDTRRYGEEADRRASRERAQLIDSERGLRERIKLLEDRLSSGESRRGGYPDSGGGGATAGELSSLRDAVVAMMSEARGIDMEKNQLEMKSEHERQLIGLERKFQRQLTDARRRNEGLIESLRQTYEDEVDSLKTHRGELIGRNKDLERELERAKGEVEVLKHRVSSAESERTLQRRFIDNAQRQSELVASFLERCPGRGGREMQGIHEELGALSVNDPHARGPGGGPGDHGSRDAAPRRGNGGPYAAANPSVFRNVPGV